MQPRFLVTHPDITTPFVQEIGVALKAAGWPVRALTNYVDQPDRRWRRMATTAGNVVGLDLDREFRRRALHDSPWDSVATFPPWELLRVALLRTGMDRRVADAVFERGIISLERRAAAALSDKVTHVYAYEFSARDTFEAAARLGIGRIYEVPSPEYDFVEKLLAQEALVVPELRTPADPYFDGKKDERLVRRKREWELADLVIVNSKFTLDTFSNAGYDTTKARIVRYGAPPVSPLALEAPRGVQGPLAVLWAGTFSARKGAHYLLEAWKRLPATCDARLDVYGAWALPPRFRDDLPPTVHFHGSIPQSELFQRYRDADILAFPTLCDGFGMVVTEAFANGLPVITTDRAGAADLVRHEENSLIIPAGDSAALLDVLEWCAGNRQRLVGMRAAAVETARHRQWSAYRDELTAVISDFFGLAIAR